ncbi:MAG: hypothetical protein ACAH88_03850, partial [Roseimicrobium sp.]
FPGQAPEVARLLTDYLSGRTDPLLGALRPLADQASLMDAGGTVEEPPSAPDPHSTAFYWATQVETLENFAIKRSAAQTAPVLS